jgi:hypothetical protein
MSILTYFIYGFLFIALILQPHLIQGHVKGINQAFAQSFSTIIILGIASGVYWLHKKDIDRREKARQLALEKLEISTDKLNDAFQYIGIANHQLPLLNKLTTKLLSRTNGNKKDRKEIFQELLATAVVSLSKAEWGVFRFVNMTTGQTIKEFIFTTEEKNTHISIGNHALINLVNSEERIKRLDNYYVISTIHKDASVQCHYIFSSDKLSSQENESILQNIVDQTQLLYKYLY